MNYRGKKQLGGKNDPLRPKGLGVQAQDNTRALPLVDVKAIDESNTLPARFNRSLVRAKQQSRTQEIADAEIARRKALIDKSNTQGGFRNSAIAEKMRFFPNDVGGWGEMIDDNLNPLKLIGSMADDLGHAKTAGDFVGAVGTPLAFGLGEGLMRRPVRPTSSQEVLSRTSGMDAVNANTPGYNSHLFKKQGYVPPTTDPALMARMSDDDFRLMIGNMSQKEKAALYGFDNPHTAKYNSPLDLKDSKYKSLYLKGMQEAEGIAGWDAAKKLEADANEFVHNATSPNFLYESKNPLYKNWDDIKKEIDVREAFDIDIPKTPSKNDLASKMMSFFPDPPMTSSEASNLLDNYNPTKYAKHDYKNLKLLEDEMHNKRLAATYMYPNAMEDASLIGPVKYDTRGNQKTLARNAMNPPKEQVVKNNDWFVKEDWKKLTQEMKWGDTEAEVEAARKAFLNNRNKKALEVTPYDMKMFRGISQQKRGGRMQKGGQYLLDGSWSPGYLDKKTGVWVSTGENVPKPLTEDELIMKNWEEADAAWQQAGHPQDYDRWKNTKELRGKPTFRDGFKGWQRGTNNIGRPFETSVSVQAPDDENTIKMDYKNSTNSIGQDFRTATFIENPGTEEYNTDTPLDKVIGKSPWLRNTGATQFNAQPRPSISGGSEVSKTPIQGGNSNGRSIGAPPVQGGVSNGATVGAPPISGGVSDGTSVGAPSTYGGGSGGTDTSVAETTTKAPHNWNTDIFFGLRGAQMAASFLAQKTRNNRMNEYDYKQQTALGKMNPMPVSQFQYSNNDYTTPNRMYAQQGGMMNPYLQHAKYGGNLKTIIREHGKWSNDAGPMDMTDGTEPRYPDRKKGGFALDEMVVRDFMSKLMHFGRGPHPYGGMRKAQQGGATRADSIAVLNSQLAQNKYYNNGKFKVTNIPGESYSFGKKEMNETTSSSLATIRRDYRLLNDYASKIGKEKASEIMFRMYKEAYGKSPKEVEQNMALQMRHLKSNQVNGDKYYYTDLITPNLDYNAPVSLVDMRIKPQGTISRQPLTNVPGNIVDTFYYDTLAVTPWDMLTPAQREQRIKKYGTSGAPKGPAPTPTMNRTVAPVEGERIFPAPRPAKSRPAKITAPNQVVDRVVPPVEAAQRPMSSDSIPVYGPANSTIGYNDNGKFVPYEGVNQRGTVNNPDSELVNNPEALKQYLRGKGFKKKGGLTANKAREILHDGTAQGHPLTDKQRRFFGAMSKGHTNYRGK